MRTRTSVFLALAVSAMACDRTPKPSEQPPSPPKVPAPTDVTATPEPPMTRPPPAPSAADVGPLATASNAFGLDLWSRLRATPGNLAISPASISIALAMAWGGARGDTSAEMKRALRLDLDADAAMTRWGQLAAALQNRARPFRLRIANRLFGEQTYHFEAAYLDRTRAAFGAPLEAIDFAASPEPARAHINQWVEAQTERRIKDLLPPRSITSDTRLVLVNAIYFLADWQAPSRSCRPARHRSRSPPARPGPRY